MNDNITTISQLKNLAEQFVKARDWHRYHTPKNLALSVAIEAAELMELYQWDEGPADIERVKEELADVLIYCLYISNTLGIDITAAVSDKMKKNELKYPAEQYKGKYRL